MQPSVALVSMPWAPIPEPSLALGILQAQLKRAGIRSRTFHANVRLLKHVTYTTYLEVAEYWGLDEFVFTELLSPGVDTAQLASLVDRCTWHSEGSGHSKRYTTPESLLDMLLTFRGSVALDYLNEVADEITRMEPTLVGFTCMFDQTMASVAVAKLIKSRSPETMIVLGGYALEGEPGEQIIRAFPWIDGVARGDGEKVILAVAHASVGEGTISSIPGVLCRGVPPVPQQNIDMRESPEPDYDDWFTNVEAFKEDIGIQIRTGALPVESSRGCWWGQHKHCVFCGIDDETLKFRFKPAAQTLDMLATVRDRYGDYIFRFSDYILPREYFKELLPELAKLTPRYRLHCEIKANQTPEKVAALAQAGFREVQPGIESFSSEVLRIMDKGVTGVQNVALLKYGYKERVVIHYNFIYGFPGETAEHYHQMIKQIPRLYHLIPPVSRSEAIVTRFAPLQNDTVRFGVQTKPLHHRCYDSLFSIEFLKETGFSLDGYAYYFERYLGFSDEMSEVYAQVVSQINHWKHLHREREVILEYIDDGELVHIRDSRYSETASELRLEGVHRDAYLACDHSPVSVENLVATLTEGGKYSRREIESALDELDEMRLVWREDQRVFGLAIPADVTAERLSSAWRNHWIAVYR